ncbi:MAG: hypothetical protein ACYC7D_06245 [Nitrososphaerales archaeon]
MKGDVSTDEESYDVIVSMEISKNGQNVDMKKVDFGKLKEAQVKGLADLFAMMSANVEYIKKLTPQFEKLDKSVPNYLQ